MSDPIIRVNGVTHDISPPEFRLIVDSWNSKVRIGFGCHIDWIAMTPRDAVRFAQRILDQSEMMLRDGAASGQAYRSGH